VCPKVAGQLLAVVLQPRAVVLLHLTGSHSVIIYKQQFIKQSFTSTGPFRLQLRWWFHAFGVVICLATCCRVGNRPFWVSALPGVGLHRPLTEGPEQATSVGVGRQLPFDADTRGFVRPAPVPQFFVLAFIRRFFWPQAGRRRD